VGFSLHVFLTAIGNPFLHAVAYTSMPQASIVGRAILGEWSVGGCILCSAHRDQRPCWRSHNVLRGRCAAPA